jgi:hypothetical protein
VRSPFGFQNCTKTAKYEALEKNVVSNGKLPLLRQSLGARPDRRCDGHFVAR